jgi:osmoprotectant transport system ATP-binding protein
MSGIVFQNVSKLYHGTPRPAVNNVSIEVKTGELIVLLGTSGCGKTTLLKMVNRLYEQTEGTILINGKDTKQVPLNELRRQIGYVIQQSGLFPHMTIEQNIAVVPEMLGWSKAEINSRIDELMELVHLDPNLFRKRYPGQMSGGQQQRVGLARALAADPPFMLMDEPFGAIDAITRIRLQDELIAIQKRLHKTILFVTHDVEEALRLADKIIVMKDGEVIQFDTPIQLIAHPKNDFVKDLIGGDDILRQMSLINVKDAMEQSKINTSHTPDNSISGNSDLKTALARLLRSNIDTLQVLGEMNQVIGLISLSHIQRLMSPVSQQTVVQGE